MIRKASSLLVAVMLTIAAWAQEPLPPRASPVDIINMKYKDAYVKITYGQPHKNGRQIFGELVPYGQVWRTGANEATEITLTHDMLINARTVKAGTYSIFTIPDKIKWTVIINSDVGLWGSYNYNPERDVIRFEVPVQELGVVYEPFTITFHQQNDRADLIMMWDKTKISVPLKFLN